MRAITAAGVVVLMTACSSVASVPASSPTTSPQSTLTASPANSYPSPPALATVDFSCRLPITRDAGPNTGDLFLDFPTRDETPAGGRGVLYDAAAGKWLPAFRNEVSPDGRLYAFKEGWSLNPPAPTRVHIVDAATGSDVRVVTMPDTQPYFVLDFSARGVDLGIGFEGRGPGVWRLDPSSGHVEKISDGFYPPDAEWIGVVDPRDTNPFGSAMTGQPGENRIDRRGSDGTVTTWFYVPQHVLTWIPFASTSTLLVAASWQGGVEYWLVSGPNKARQLFQYRYQQSSPYTDLNGGFNRAFADTHGIWIGGGSLYLVTDSGSVLKVDDRPGYPAGTCD